MSAIGHDKKLIDAASAGNVKEAEEALKNGANIHAVDDEKNGRNALHIAAIHGHDQMIVLLLKHGAKSETLCKQLQITALHYACRGPDATCLASVRALLAGGADIDARSGGSVPGETPLHYAAYFGRYNTLKCLLASGADYDAHSYPPTKCTAAQRGRTNPTIGEESARIIEAYIKNPMPFVKFKLKSAPDLTSHDKKLIDAAKAGNVKDVEAALINGANIHVVEDEETGWNALHHAANRGHHEMVTFLLKNNAKPETLTNDSKITALHIACTGDSNVATVRALLCGGANIEARSGLGAKVPGETPLHSAAYWGQYDILKFLLGNGADPNALSSAKQTALVRAKQQPSGAGHESVRIIEEFGKDPKPFEKFKIVTPVVETVRVIEQGLKSANNTSFALPLLLLGILCTLNAPDNHKYKTQFFGLLLVLFSMGILTNRLISSVDRVSKFTSDFFNKHVGPALERHGPSPVKVDVKAEVAKEAFKVEKGAFTVEAGAASVEVKPGAASVEVKPGAVDVKAPMSVHVHDCHGVKLGPF